MRYNNSTKYSFLGLMLLILVATTFADSTLFLAHYDGDTGNGGLDADAARGLSSAISFGAETNANSKFGAGSINITGSLKYARENNFNPDAGTIEMWINPNNWYDGGYQGLFGLKFDNGHDIRIQKRNTNKLHVYQTSDAGSWGIYDAEVPITDGQWHHLAWTWDVDANSIGLYLDGQVLSQASYGEIVNYEGPLAVHFMIGDMDNQHFFNGLIDEVRISDSDIYGGQPFVPQTGPWSVSGCWDELEGDLTGDCIVNGDDLEILTQNWLESGGIKTLFLAHYDGDTGNSGLDADYAEGPSIAVKSYGAISSTTKFGAGAYLNLAESVADPDNDVLSYYREGNLNNRSGTVEMWIRPTDWNNGAYQGLFGIRVDNDHEIRIQKRDNNQLIAYYNSDAGSWGTYINDVILDNNQWYHLAWTWDVDTQLIGLYLDGVLLESTTFGTMLEYEGAIAPTFTIGDFDPKGGPYRFLGQIDEVRISNGDRYKGKAFTPQSAPFDVD